MQKTDYDEHKIEEAMTYLFESMKTSTNSKPVAFHSVRVAAILWNTDADEESIIAALLHDLVEDTEVTIEQIENKFGQRVANIVEACTFDSGSDDYSEKIISAKASVDKVVNLGLNATLVKAADFIDNSKYYSRVEDEKLKTYLHDKYLYFMNQSHDLLSGSEIWKQIVFNYNEHAKSLLRN